MINFLIFAFLSSTLLQSTNRAVSQQGSAVDQLFTLSLFHNQLGCRLDFKPFSRLTLRIFHDQLGCRLDGHHRQPSLTSELKLPPESDNESIADYADGMGDGEFYVSSLLD